MTRWRAALHSDKVRLVNEISIEFQPFNILNVHEEICSCHLACKLPWALSFWHAKRSHPCKYRNCPFCFFLLACFHLFNINIQYFLFCFPPPLSLSPLIVFVSVFCSPGRQTEKKIPSRSASETYTRWGLSYQTGEHYMTLACSLSSLLLTQNHNQACFWLLQLPWAKTQWLYIWQKLS